MITATLKSGLKAGQRHDPPQPRPPPYAGAVVLEEFAFTAEPNTDAQTIANWLGQNALPSGSEYDYWRRALPQRLVILPENAFRDFTQFSTEVISRIRLDDEKKTVARGALWSEEPLPSDTCSTPRSWPASRESKKQNYPTTGSSPAIRLGRSSGS
jgi:CRISPR type III-B/RAMP module RAMP protein Cmr4